MPLCIPSTCVAARDHFFWADLSEQELPHVLINNAGIYPAKDLLDIDEAFLRKSSR